MERKLRIKIISITMAAVFIILSLVLFGFNLSNYTDIDDKADLIISLMETNDGVLPNELGQVIDKYGESASSIRYFTVMYAEEGIKVDISNFSSITVEEAIDLAESLSSESGFVGQYKYKAIDCDGRMMLVFLDCSYEIIMYRATLLNSIYIGLLALLGVLILAVIFSKKAVKPFVENNENQKKFITDVSHELKTPLAIIKGNVEVLEMQNGSSLWTEDIHTQIDGLNELIMYLIRLSKMEESEELHKEKFNLSKLVEENCDNIAVLSEKRMNRAIKSDIFFFGDIQLIKMLISIILENAVKYTTGGIDIFLDDKTLQITNECESIQAGNYDKWFDRFYKEDSSRSRNGSFGIGLSMAKNIAIKHNAKITAFSKDGKNVTVKVDF